MAQLTFKQFQAVYPDDAACLAKLMEVNYGGTEIICPGCGADTKFHPLSKRRAFVCQLCGHHVYPAADTIFHKSRTNLTKWFFAMYLMTSTRHGVAAKEIERQIGVTYKCAWRMCHELRKLMASADYRGPLGGPGKHVEIDETYVGGKQKRRVQRAIGTNKTTVLGMVERDGRIRAAPIPDAWLNTIEPVVRANVARGSTVSTDEHGGFTCSEWRMERSSTPWANTSGASTTRTRLRATGHTSSAPCGARTSAFRASTCGSIWRSSRTAETIASRTK
jgi:transposase